MSFWLVGRKGINLRSNVGVKAAASGCQIRRDVLLGLLLLGWWSKEVENTE